MKQIPFARPFTTKREIKYVSKAIRSGWLTTGKVTAQFETEFAKTVGAKYALAVNSATAGLHLALLASGITNQDSVITTPYTFVATAEVISYIGAEIKFVDIEKDSPLIDLNKIADAITSKTKAVIPVHYGGESVQIQALMKICKPHNIACIEDAAHAFPAKTENSYVGTQGDIGVYSFYATKTLTTAEGGMIITKNKQFYEAMKQLRLHGINKDIWDRYTNTKANWEYDVVTTGFKYNLTDIASSLGLAQLSIADKMQERRTAIAKNYLKELRALHEMGLVDLPRFSPCHSWHLFPIQIPEQGSFLENRALRDRWMNQLSQKGIGLSVHYKPLHLMSYFQKEKGYTPNDFPNASNRFSRSFSLPIYPGLTKAQCNYIIKALKEVIKNGC